MKVTLQSVSAYNKFQNRKLIPFKSKTIFQDNKIIENDLLSLSNKKKFFSNPLEPEQEILGAKIERIDDKNISITSRFGHKIGLISYNPSAKQPQINLQMGSFQPVIELHDDELGISVLMTRGSNLKGSDLNINYKDITPSNVSFGNNLVITTGYKADKTKQNVREYVNSNKGIYASKPTLGNKLKNDYTIIGLGSGKGSRLKPISDLNDDNKNTTKYPGTNKSLFDISVMDTALNAVKIDKIKFINDNPDSLSGTAGIIIKGIKDGTIPIDKPLVLLTGDIFHNMDLAKILETYEQNPQCGIGLVVKKLEPNEVKGNALVKFVPQVTYKSGIISYSQVVDSSKACDIDELSPIMDENNIQDKSEYLCSPIGNQNSLAGYYTSANITVINPKILAILKDYADKNGKADFVEFLGLMFNVLNKPDQLLRRKYPHGLHSKDLKLSDLSDSYGFPKDIKSANGENLKLQAIIAKDSKGKDPFFADMGTVEKYIDTVKTISKQSSITGLNYPFVSAVKNHVDTNGIIYMNTEAKDKLKAFKEKYNISELSGNVIIHSSNKPAAVQQKLSPQSGLYALTNDDDSAREFIKKLMAEPEKLNEKAQELISKYGLKAFVQWYISPNGYYGQYEKYMYKFYNEAKSIDELLKFAPNWSPWKLERKQWELSHPEYADYREKYRNDVYFSQLDTRREFNFTIGSLPDIFYSKSDFTKIVDMIKTREILDEEVRINYREYKLTRLKGGELNDKFIYLIERDGEKAILKLDRMNVEDSETVNGRELSIFEKKVIRKNKLLAPDSVYSNACISKYLELNGCTNLPKVYYYDYESNAGVFEYIEDKEGDKFQHGEIDEEYSGLKETNKALSTINKLGIFINDTAEKNILTDKNGEDKVIDFGHSNFILPFKLGVKHLNIEFANTNGPSINTILASLMLDSMSNN